MYEMEWASPSPVYSTRVCFSDLEKRLPLGWISCWFALVRRCRWKVEVKLSNHSLAIACPEKLQNKVLSSIWIN